MAVSRNLFSPLAKQRPLLAVLAGFALAFGMLAPHDVAVEQAGAVARVEIAETAVHPDAPAHFEEAELKVHSGCVGCLLQLGSSTVLKPPPAPLAPPSRDDRFLAAAAQLSSSPLPLPGPARAPPVSLLA